MRINENEYMKQKGWHRNTLPGICSVGDVAGDYKQMVIASGQAAETAMMIFEDITNL